MTIPRFTPDPLPDGLDPELAAYLQRQFDRISDWWPLNCCDVVDELARLNPTVSGEFSILETPAMLTILPTAEIAGNPEAPCSPAIFPVEYSDTVGQINDVSDQGYPLTLINSAGALTADGSPAPAGLHPDAQGQYLSTDVPDGLNPPSWWLRYTPIIFGGEGFYGVSENRNAARWTLSKGYLQFYAKRANVSYNSSGDNEWIINAFAQGNFISYGFRLYVRPPVSNKAGAFRFEVGISGTNAYIRYETVAAYFNTAVWRKIRIEWDPALVTVSTYQSAVKIYVDDVEVAFTATTLGTVSGWTVTDAAQYTAATDPDRNRIKLYIGATSTPESGKNGFNGLLKDIYISNCPYE